jgi:hypothetical protein
MTIPSTTPGTLGRAQTPIAAIVRRLAVIAALTLTVLGLGVPAASAGEPQQIRTHGGHAVFDDLGELLVVTDTRRDGLSVMANLTWADGSITATDSGPGGSGETKNVSIREGTVVWLIMCYEVNGVTVKCSHSQRGVA